MCHGLNRYCISSGNGGKLREVHIGAGRDQQVETGSKTKGQSADTHATFTKKHKERNTWRTSRSKVSRERHALKHVSRKCNAHHHESRRGLLTDFPTRASRRVHRLVWLTSGVQRELGRETRVLRDACPLTSQHRTTTDSLACLSLPMQLQGLSCRCTFSSIHKRSGVTFRRT